MFVACLLTILYNNVFNHLKNTTKNKANLKFKFTFFFNILIFIVSYSLISLIEGSSAELKEKRECYGRSITIPFEYMTSVFNGKLYFTPTRGRRRVLIENKQVRSSCSCDIHSMQDLASVHIVNYDWDSKCLLSLLSWHIQSKDPRLTIRHFSAVLKDLTEKDEGTFSVSVNGDDYYTFDIIRLKVDGENTTLMFHSCIFKHNWIRKPLW